ncbi:hypothetical protein B0T22DRAFT_467535 [Podospora appendiculata]|uniref:Uncharacterized protein n=1 Tax=Podospora appendiculata TaxID=314037 RepID=A0AAE0X6S1_9PEZI|nr:hypothetical protein B0T22DRAFT_467535 [Podospora appendiculata]
MEAEAIKGHNHIKQTFIIATLASTLAGTFTTGINLYDRVNEKRKQRKLDRGQNKKIKDLEKRLNEATNNNKRPETPPPEKQQQHRDDGDDRDYHHRDRSHGRDLRDSLQSSGPMVQREFDQHYAQLGPRFAQGDLIAQTQLQSQVITLQSTVIALLQDALFTDRPIDMAKLYEASELAREGTIQALRDQHQRLIAPASPPQQQQQQQQQLTLPSRARRPHTLRRSSSTPTISLSTTSTTTSSAESTPSSRHTALSRRPPQLFCPYATHLQQTPSSPLPATCPTCATPLILQTAQGRQQWKIDKDVTISERVIKSRDPAQLDELVKTVEARSYLLTSRFMAKCHRPGPEGGYACVLCARYRERDTVCRFAESLARHVAERHVAEEVMADGDVRDVTR